MAVSTWSGVALHRRWLAAGALQIPLHQRRERYSHRLTSRLREGEVQEADREDLSIISPTGRLGEIFLQA